MHRNPAYRILSAQTLEEAASACLDAAVRLEDVLSGAVYARNFNRCQWFLIGYQTKEAKFVQSDGCFDELEFPLAPDCIEPVPIETGIPGVARFLPIHPEGTDNFGLIAFPAVCKERPEGALVVSYPPKRPLEASEFESLTSISVFLGGALAHLTTKRELARCRNHVKTYRTIVDATPHIIGISTIEAGHFIDANEAFSRMLGYTKEEVLGKSSKELGIFVDPEMRDEGMKLYLRDGKLDRFKMQYRSKTGEILDVLVSANPIEYQGRPCLLTIHTDITPLKQAQKELEKAKTELETRVRERTRELEQANLTLSGVEERLRAAYDGMPVPLYMLKRKDDDFVLIDFNKAAAEESDGRLKNLVGVKAKGFYASQNRSDIFDSMDQAYRRKKTIIRDISYKYHTTGIERELIASFSYVPPDIVLMSSIDISERKEAERQLVSYQDQLRRLAAELTAAESRERRRIAGDLHDQIGQILFLAKVKLRSLLKIEHPEVKEAARDIEELIGWALRDVRTMIVDISPPILYELGLVEALRDFGENLQAEHGIRTVVVDDGRPIRLSPDMLDLVFRATRELAINVLKHANASNLTMTLDNDTDRLIVKVQDDGIGFTPETAFSPREDDTGFGLFSLRERLTSIGGRLEVHSKPGQGAKVIMEIPSI